MQALELVFFRMMDKAPGADAAELAELLLQELVRWRGFAILPHHRKAIDEFADKLTRYIV